MYLILFLECLTRRIFPWYCWWYYILPTVILVVQASLIGKSFAFGDDHRVTNPARPKDGRRVRRATEAGNYLVNTTQQGVAAGTRVCHQRRHSRFPGDTGTDHPSVPAQVWFQLAYWPTHFWGCCRLIFQVKYTCCRLSSLTEPWTCSLHMDTSIHQTSVCVCGVCFCGLACTTRTARTGTTTTAAATRRRRRTRRRKRIRRRRRTKKKKEKKKINNNLIWSMSVHSHWLILGASQQSPGRFRVLRKGFWANNIARCGDCTAGRLTLALAHKNIEGRYYCSK